MVARLIILIFSISLTDICFYCSDRAGGEAQPSQVSCSREYGGCAHKNEQFRRGYKSLPEATYALQTNPG